MKKKKCNSLKELHIKDNIYIFKKKKYYNFITIFFFSKYSWLLSIQIAKPF
jgi:hypothetical protein